MTTRMLTQVALRIWSVMLLTRAVIAVPPFVSYLMPGTTSTVDAGMLLSLRLTTFATLGLLALMAFVIFRFAPALATWIGGDDHTTSIKIDAPAILSVGLAIIGLTTIVDGLLELGPALYAWLMAPDRLADSSFMSDRRSGAIIRGMLGILIGAALYLGRDALLRGWHRMRGQET